MKIDMDSEDAPWNGYLWKKQIQVLEHAIDAFGKNPDDYDTGYSHGMNSAMHTLLHALKSDWSIKALERKAEEL